jgi:hypothetical protein
VLQELLLEVQPAIDNDATITIMAIANNFFSIHVPPDGQNQSRMSKGGVTA